MKMKPLHIFGFIMSFTYVLFGMLILLTPFLTEMIENPTYRKMFGSAVVVYGLFRVRYFFQKLREKS